MGAPDAGPGIRRAAGGGTMSGMQRSRSDMASSLDGHRGQYWRGRLPVPEHTHPLVRQFFELLNAQRATMPDVTRRAGPHWSTVQSLGKRYSPQIEHYDADLKAIGRSEEGPVGKGGVRKFKLRWLPDNYI